MAKATAKASSPKSAKAKPRAAAAKSNNGAAEVDAYMASLSHPMKAQVQAIRKVILSTAPGIMEQVKWNAPSFRTAKDYLCTFSLRPNKPLLLIFHNRLIPSIQSPILDGDYRDRRLVTFADSKDVKAKTPEIRRVVAALVKEMQA